MENSKSSNQSVEKTSETSDVKAQNTSFDAADLTIRNRVKEYSDALSNMSAKTSKQKDALFSQLCSEVENLQSQLRNAEQMFGAGDEMVSVLKEALQSAECRRETRRIELGLDGEEEGDKTGNVEPFPARDEERYQTVKQEDGLDWEWLLVWIAIRQNKNRPYSSIANSNTMGAYR